MGKLAVVVGKSKKKSIKKKGPAKQPSKFISQALVNKKKAAKGKKHKRPKTKGLVYVKNLPHGFFEEQLRNYFSQFGAVTRLRLGRSPKTLNSRGYAFVEFRYPEVAEIAAQTMNNYIMFHRIVKAKFIPPNEIHHDYFRSSIMTVKKDGEKVLTSKSILARETVVENTNKLMTDDDQKKRINKVRNRVTKQKAKLASLGIDFDIDMVAKNMSEEVIKPIQKTEMTIEDLKDEDLDDEADETFDPAKFDIDSEDEFQDFAYDSIGSDSDEVTEPAKKEAAIELAKKVSKKKQKEKETVKSKKIVKSEEPPAANKLKAEKKKAEKPAKKQKVSQDIEKAVKKASNKKEQQELPVMVAKKLKSTQKKSTGAEKKKTAKKVGKENSKESTVTKKVTKEPAVLKKVSKASKSIKKVTK